jgi:hypothetical protein
MKDLLHIIGAIDQKVVWSGALPELYTHFRKISDFIMTEIAMHEL